MKQKKKQKKKKKIARLYEIKLTVIYSYSCRYDVRVPCKECPRGGGSNEYPQSMFFSKIRKIMYTPVNPGFTI